jgi:hypothetical protein
MPRGGGGISLGMRSKQNSPDANGKIVNPHVAFVRRIGPDPHANGAQTQALNNCPDLFELETGDFAVIGIDVTETARAKLPPTAGCGPDERIVWIPRKLLVLAKADIPNQV